MSERTPDRIRLAVEARAGGDSVVEQAVRWKPRTWDRPGLEMVRTEIDKAEELSEEGVDGWLWIRRRHVIEIARDRCDPLGCFVASMIWGFGDRGYGAARTEAMIRPYTRGDLEGVLRRIAKAALLGPAAAWDAITVDHRIKYLGPAFGTKVIYFMARASDSPPSPIPLIADANTSRAMAILCGLSRSAWRRNAYLEYVDRAHGWAEELGCPVDEVEHALFEVGRSVR